MHMARSVLLYLDAPIRSRDEEVAARRQRQHPARVIRLVNSHLQCKTQTGYIPHTIESPFTPGRHANGVIDEPAAKNHTQRSKVARVHIVHTRMVHPHGTLHVRTHTKHTHGIPTAGLALPAHTPRTAS